MSTTLSNSNYLIEGIEFNMSSPLETHWHSKAKQRLLKNDLEYIKMVLTDAIYKREHPYSNKYYACAKFIRHTTNLSFSKNSNKIFYVVRHTDDFMDKFIVDGKEQFVCHRRNILIDGDVGFNGGKTMGLCKNGCCKFMCKLTRKFNIKWQ